MKEYVGHVENGKIYEGNKFDWKKIQQITIA